MVDSSCGALRRHVIVAHYFRKAIIRLEFATKTAAFSLHRRGSNIPSSIHGMPGGIFNFAMTQTPLNLFP